MPQQLDFMATLREAARLRDPDARADLYSQAMFAGLEAAAVGLAGRATTPEDRVALLMFMRAFARPAWMPLLSEWQRDGDEGVRAMVAAALLFQPPAEATLAMMRVAAADPSTMVRARAVRAMQGADPAFYGALLAQMAREDLDAGVRALASAGD